MERLTISSKNRKVLKILDWSYRPISYIKKVVTTRKLLSFDPISIATQITLRTVCNTRLLLYIFTFINLLSFKVCNLFACQLHINWSLYKIFNKERVYIKIHYTWYSYNLIPSKSTFLWELSEGLQYAFFGVSQLR